MLHNNKTGSKVPLQGILGASGCAANLFRQGDAAMARGGFELDPGSPVEEDAVYDQRDAGAPDN